MKLPKIGQRYPQFAVGSFPGRKFPGGRLLRKVRLRKKRRTFNAKREARIQFWMDMDTSKMHPISEVGSQTITFHYVWNESDK